MFVDGYYFHILPENLETYEHQIAGHGFGLEDNKRKVLQDDEERVYKPVQSFPKGQREIDFYQKVYGSNCPVLKQLRQFLPHFHGIFINNKTGDKYICLDDVLSQFKKPTVADVKIGALTYTPDACPKKVLAEKAKYAFREQVGFLFTGIKVYHGTNNFDYFDKQHGKNLNCDDVYTKGILEFLGKDKVRAKQLARKFVHKLNRLKAWFESQTTLSFYSSSLLLSYEGCPSKPMSRPRGASGAKDNSQGSSKHKHHIEDLEDDIDFSSSDMEDDDDDVMVGWVDFTHTVNLPSDQSQHDDNFLYGLNNLICYFQRTYTSNITSPTTTFHLNTTADNNSSIGTLDSPEISFVISQSNNNVIPTNPLNLYVAALAKKSSALQLTSSNNYSPADSAYSDSDSSNDYQNSSSNSNLTCLMQSTTSPMSRINNFMDKEIFQQAAAM